jgi:hypothetical protein
MANQTALQKILIVCCKESTKAQANIKLAAQAFIDDGGTFAQIEDLKSDGYKAIKALWSAGLPNARARALFCATGKDYKAIVVTPKESADRNGHVSAFHAFNQTFRAWVQAIEQGFENLSEWRAAQPKTPKAQKAANPASAKGAANRGAASAKGATKAETLASAYALLMAAAVKSKLDTAPLIALAEQLRIIEK